MKNTSSYKERTSEDSREENADFSTNPTESMSVEELIEGIRGKIQQTLQRKANSEHR